MRRSQSVCWAIGATAMLVALPRVEAQYPPFGGAGGAGGTKPPALSPYLNLLRPGDPAINYFGLVRPQTDFRNSIQNLGGAVTALQSAPVLQLGEELPLSTGHAATFMTQSRYFMTRGSRMPGQGMGGIRPGMGAGQMGAGRPPQMGNTPGGGMGGMPGMSGMPSVPGMGAMPR